MADKRSLAVRVVPNKGSMYEIYYEGGGEVPDSLKGMYTSEYVANAAIITHLSLEIHEEKKKQQRTRKSERVEELKERGLM